ncbi:MAG TPA: prepilin-type N-terminal cleavage/methylation domain-containing protein [Gallionella sp.]|nr:prepilin-type N-terminal cleavage/methylation domain-containing protein [Gallionella sp.]
MPLIKSKRRKALWRGFSLVELAIVLIILGLLMTGLAPSLSARIDALHLDETRKSMKEIQEALLGFAVANGRLPWPACGTLAAGQSNAGIELSPASATAIGCTADMAVLPWATLGTSETDAWGNRYTYRVSSDFADVVGDATYGGCTPGTLPAQSTFALCSSGNLNVLSAAGGTNLATNLPAVIVSHGKNGAGAYTPQGTRLPVSGNADELENSYGAVNNNYVSHPPTAEFDDLVVWIPTPILFNRMVAAGKLP